MAFQLYLRPYPRALYLVSSTTALVLQQPELNDKDDKAEIELLALDDVDLTRLVRINKAPCVTGVLGLLSIPVAGTNEIFLLVSTAAIVLPPLLPGTTLTASKLLAVEFHCLTSGIWDDASVVPLSVRNETDSPAFDDLEFNQFGSYPQQQSSAATRARSQVYSNTTSPASSAGLAHPCDGMKRYLETGTFYFATTGNWNISKSLASWDWAAIKRGDSTTSVLDDYDDSFVWNSNILRPLLNFRSHLSPSWRDLLDSERMLVPVIQGFTGVIPIGISGTSSLGKKVHLGLISRLGWKRAGARFKTRGVDDEGNVANFVETETVIATEDSCMSFVQVRGSVPLFWEQQGSQTFGHKLQITRPQAASQAAFDKHFISLVSHYGSVHAINLLGGGESEQVLSEAYNKHLQSLINTLRSDEETFETNDPVGLTAYDFHAQVRAGGHDLVKEDFQQRLAAIREAREKFRWTVIDRAGGELVERQQGVFRTNCLDCLDRTNYVEDVISAVTTNAFISQISTPTSSVPPNMLTAAHRELWADNGDALSRIYAGTGALNTSVTRSGGKRGWGALFSDASKSVGRAIQATFGDQEKQMSIDLFLGIMAGQRPVQVYDPISDAIHSQLKARLSEYSSIKQIQIFCGTWNLNGKPLSGNLGLWLFPEGVTSSDVYCIAFQELVPLNAQQILQTDPAPRRRCEEMLSKAFAQQSEKNQFVLLRSEQLVGTAIFVFARKELLPHIARVEGASRKTGLRGMSGNKGGCGVRFDLYDTSLCLMTCHLAAGHSNVTERNADYKTISHELSFQRGRRIDDHGLVIWSADFNYRIDLTNEEVRERIADGDLQPLWEADQVSRFTTARTRYQLAHHKQLRNAIMYKDAFEEYQEGEITFAPVYATFNTEVHIIDHAKEEFIRHTLTTEVLKREVNSAKGNRRPPPIPAAKKPDAIDLDRSFKELKFDAKPGVAGQGAAEDTGAFRQQGNKTTAKRSPSPISSSIEDGFVKVRYQMTGSTNNSSTSLHTMSPLNSSVTNLTSGSSNATVGSQLRRVPPALPGLPSRPSRSGSRSAVPTLDKVDEKVGRPKITRGAEKPTENTDSPVSISHAEESNLPHGSGVARLIAEANRRAQEAGAANAKSATISSTTPATPKVEVAQRQSPALSRSVPTLPARSISVPAHENLKNSVPDLITLSSEKSPALPLPPRRDSIQSVPSRKGSLNVAMRGSLPSDPTLSTGNTARSASSDSGKPRRLPPPVANHSDLAKAAFKDGREVVELAEQRSEATKKAKPSVPPKPRNLM
ncbi:hypothetical protein QFC20_006632 [Naganishia adeliensis]|uniref:Uncharacterized protein n=1 Tax=Naganishia adeliensis TaxID=92952 RepID=A0ACC2V937_9TREE|nr:hypothetical protein QFC20_006632 [Naganishia adeliensis]